MQWNPWLAIFWLLEVGVPMTPLGGTGLGYGLVCVAALICLWQGWGWASRLAWNQGAAKFLLFVPTVLLAVMGVLWSYYGFPDPTKPVSTNQEVVYRKTFMNEVVEMDGKTFSECRFINATLNFKGIAPTTFLNSRFSGFTQILTDNWAVKSFSGLVEEFKKHKEITNVLVMEKDESGSMRILSNTALHPPQKSKEDDKSEK